MTHDSQDHKGVWKFIIGGIILFGLWYYVNNTIKITRAEAIAEYWDTIKTNVSGREIVEACNENKECYNLDADIKDGKVVRIHFPNKGYQDMYENIDKNGWATYSETDTEKSWDIKFDMNSVLVDDALDEWQKDNNLRDFDQRHIIRDWR